ncbi:MAG: glycosyltransferase [Verrucomicrobiota bacterium]
MKLIIVHYHLRPGGVRRIIELAAPHLVAQFDGRITDVILAGGEALDRKWNENFRQGLPGVRVTFCIEPVFKYLSEQRFSAALTRRIEAAVNRLLGDDGADDALVWAHNLGIARNLPLVDALTRACDERGITLVMHHHDWWFDNRWQRWPEMRRNGVRSLQAPARIVFPSSPGVRHAAINHVDAALLERQFPARTGWLPNLTEPMPPPSAERLRAAKDWLRHKLNDADAPVWILPCRLLRRKNIAEALLLTRWLRPEAWLVTTGDVSSEDERAYAEKFTAAAHAHHWRLRLGILAGDETRKPGVAELLAASEAVVLTSIQEGFGLPYLEAAAAGRPLVARALPNISPDLKRFGFHFPQLYDEILVDPRLFDWEAEQQRQQKLFARWRARLPAPCRPWAGTPVMLSRRAPQPVPFSRLTLTAQLEVLAQPAKPSWELCAPLNPELSGWKKRAGAGKLKSTPWPRTADRWLGGAAYAKRFAQLATGNARRPASASAALRAQAGFMREKLGAEHLFPLLWDLDT